MAVDVTDADFATTVIARSRELPVVVDFWAEWCGPCRALGPVLEQAAAERAGKVVLAKLDTDANPRTARQYAIQSIPAVKAFRDGEVAEEFIGAVPPAAVARFFDALVPSEADALVAAGDEESLRRAHEIDPRRTDAALGLARILHARGDADDALALVEPIAGDFGAEGLAARIRLQRAGDPDLDAAFEALDAGRHEQALEALLEALGSTENGTREDVRRAIVGVLDELGVEHPLAREGRRRMAAALY